VPKIGFASLDRPFRFKTAIFLRGRLPRQGQQPNIARAQSRSIIVQPRAARYQLKPSDKSERRLNSTLTAIPGIGKDFLDPVELRLASRHAPKRSRKFCRNFVQYSRRIIPNAATYYRIHMHINKMHSNNTACDADSFVQRRATKRIIKSIRATPMGGEFECVCHGNPQTSQQCHDA
jgi:hypothetical protein